MVEVGPAEQGLEVGDEQGKEAVQVEQAEVEVERETTVEIAVDDPKFQGDFQLDVGELLGGQKSSSN